MKRRDLIRGVASTGLVAVSAGAAAGQVTDSPDGDAPYRAIRQDDGSYEVVHVDGAGLGPENYREECNGLPYDWDCEVPNCANCYCECCKCYYWPE